MKKFKKITFTFLTSLFLLSMLSAGCSLVDDEVTVDNGIDGGPVTIKQKPKK